MACNAEGDALPSITYEEARDQAIGFGWIDGLEHALDEQFYAMRFTPRRARSRWSQINRDVVASCAPMLPRVSGRSIWTAGHAPMYSYVTSL